MADLLASGADVNARTVSGDTPLHRAAKTGRKKVGELLLTKGAQVNAKDNKGWTPLHEAVCNNKKEIVALLLAAGADINAKRENENTPFHDAVCRGQTQIVELLLAAGSGVNTRDEDGLTALDRAVSHHDWSLAALLVRRGGRMSSRRMLNLAWKWVGIPLIALSCWGGLAFGSTVLMHRLCPLLPAWAARSVGIASIPFAAFCTTALLTDRRRRKPLLIAWGLFAFGIAVLSHEVSPWFTSWEGVTVFASLAGAIACPLVLVLPETALGTAARAIRAITMASRRTVGGLARARGEEGLARATAGELAAQPTAKACNKCGRTLETLRKDHAEVMRLAEALYSADRVVIVDGDDRLHYCRSCRKSFCYRCLERGLQCSVCPECGADIWDPFGITL